MLLTSACELTSDAHGERGYDPLHLRVAGIAVDQAQVEATLRAAEDYFGQALPEHVIYTFVPTTFPCTVEGHEGVVTCSGITTAARGHVQVAMTLDQTATPTRCVPLTSLAHEAVHLLVGDFGHRIPGLWAPGGAAQQIGDAAASMCE